MATTKRQPKKALSLRIDPQDRALFDRAADVQHETLTQFLVESGRERAERLFADRNSFSIDSDSWRDLMAAMDRPAEARPELVDLFSRTKPE
jgi:uncharacterized protein (DUF1778 family)